MEKLHQLQSKMAVLQPKLSIQVVEFQADLTIAASRNLNLRRLHRLHQSTAASTWWCGPLLRLGWVEMAVGFFEGPN